ncbi:MAG TPA: PDZ domain-containing protein [Vicinamibacterales bacterium]
MKNVKFGALFLGLAAIVVTAVSTLSAQTRVQVEPRVRGDRNVMVLDGRGAELGVMVSDLEVKAGTGGVRIDEVHADSPAEKAGIKAGDVIVEFDGERVRSARQFTRLVQETPDGRSVAIALLREGKKQTVNATPESGRMTWNSYPNPVVGSREPHEFAFRGMPEFNFDFDDRMPRRFEYRLPETFAIPGPGSPLQTSRGRLGISVQSITPELGEYFGVKNGGALVSRVTPDSAAAKAGIKAGDVITSINGRRVDNSDALVRELDDLTGDVTIVVTREKKELTLKATLDRQDAAPRAGSRPGMF